MADTAHTKTDQKLEEMEKRLSAIYSRAEKEIQQTADEYFSKFAKQDESKRKLLEQGKITEEEYTKWRKGKVMYGKRFAEMKEQCAKQLLNVNQTALAYVNGELPEVYAINYNALESAVDGVGGYSFTLVDADTVRNLAVTDTSLLPYKEIDPEKDVQWNMKKINAETLQGILQGESMDKIAKRIMNVQTMNKDAAIRSARTIVTNAECKGRQDSYQRAKDDGIILRKYWLATYDKRARDWHKAAGNDYTEEKAIEIDDFFIVDGEKMLHPGDSMHGASGHNLYNCRCSIASKVIGFKKVQVQKAMDEKQEYTQAEQDEFAALQKKYKNKTQVMLFGTEEEMVRYDYLLQKDKANAGTFDYYKKFQHQSIAESSMNGWRVEPTTAERDAISSYSRSGYLKMNENLRFGNYATDSVKREISALHGFLDKCETQDELYLSRGVTKPALDKMFGGDGWRKNSSSLVGSVFKDKGFVSTTPYQGGGFGGDVVMYIKAPKGTKGAYIKDFAASSEEKEFLIQSDTSFVVRNIVEEVDEWDDKKYKVFAEVIV